jgi:hypothetical protein
LLSGAWRRSNSRASLVVPESVEAFEALVRGKSPAHVVGECMRVLKCNDSVQLEHFFDVLLGVLLPRRPRRPAPLALLNALVAPLSVLTNAHANVATRACRALVRDMTPGAALHELEQVDVRCARRRHARRVRCAPRRQAVCAAALAHADAAAVARDAPAARAVAGRAPRATPC